MTKKILFVIAVTIMSLGICFGCKGSLPYKATVIGSGVVCDWNIVPRQIGYFTDNFWKENLIGGVAYNNENRNCEDPNDEEYITFDDLPIERVRIIRNKEECENTFLNPIEIDFEKEIIIVYMFCSNYTRTVKVKNIRAVDKNLFVEYTMAKGKLGYKDASAPQRRFMVIKMDNPNVDTI